MKNLGILSIVIFIVLTSFTENKFGFNYKNGSEMLNVGDPAPNIKLKSLKGKKQKLKKYKNKLVLVKFWASWCAPCRMFKDDWNRVYEKNKNKKFKNGKNGFDVFSISLDDSKRKFKKASKEDNISWKANTVDLDGFNSIYAFIYGVNSLPAEFLLDGDGNIIAKDFTPYELERLLKQFED